MREDEKAAIRLYNDLKNSGFPIKPWIDKEDLLPGQDFNREIKNLIRTCTFFFFTIVFLYISSETRIYPKRIQTCY